MAKIVDKITYAGDFEIVKFEVPSCEMFEDVEYDILNEDSSIKYFRFLGSHGSFTGDGMLYTYYLCSSHNPIPIDVLCSATDLIKIVTNIKL